MTEQNPNREMVLYVLLPTDLPSLRPEGSLGGKLSAQVSHSGIQLATKYSTHPDFLAYMEDGISGGADHFNTCITLDATLNQIKNVVEIASRCGFLGDVVVDPSYPFFETFETAKLLNSEVTVVDTVKKDGQVLCLRKQTTCGWILGNKMDPVFAAIVGKFNLAK
jgi:hypothetical protein